MFFVNIRWLRREVLTMMTHDVSLGSCMNKEILNHYYGRIEPCSLISSVSFCTIIVNLITFKNRESIWCTRMFFEKSAIDSNIWNIDLMPNPNSNDRRQVTRHGQFSSPLFFSLSKYRYCYGFLCIDLYLQCILLKIYFCWTKIIHKSTVMIIFIISNDYKLAKKTNKKLQIGINKTTTTFKSTQYSEFSGLEY